MGLGNAGHADLPRGGGGWDSPGQLRSARRLRSLPRSLGWPRAAVLHLHRDVGLVRRVVVGVVVMSVAGCGGGADRHAAPTASGTAAGAHGALRVAGHAGSRDPLPHQRRRRARRRGGGVRARRRRARPRVPGGRGADGGRTRTTPRATGVQALPGRQWSDGPTRSERRDRSWQHPDRALRPLRPDPCSFWTLAHDLDVSDTWVRRLRAWSTLSGWRFESSSAHWKATHLRGFRRQRGGTCSQRRDHIRGQTPCPEVAG